MCKCTQGRVKVPTISLDDYEVHNDAAARGARLAGELNCPNHPYLLVAGAYDRMRP